MEPVRHAATLAAAPLRMPRALREFLRAETAGGAALIGAAGAALVWANSPWKAAYTTLWTTELSVRLGRFALAGDLRQWVNEGLMALFFLVVGLEIKRELVDGELRSLRRAALPLLAAVGGMALPAGIYALVNAGGPGAPGWGIPMATDIAFALGVLALLGERVPPALKLFLLALAIVDDLGSILVVAAFYRRGSDAAALAAAAGLVLLVVALRRARIGWMPVYVGVGVGLWLALRAAGISPAVAGAAMGLLAPARPFTDPGMVRARGDELAAAPGPAPLREVVREARGTVSTAERLEHDLHPLTAFVVVPLFGLANAGVTLELGQLGRPGTTAVLAGVVVGRVLGKLVGITLAVWLAVRLRVGVLPTGVRWAHLVGAATIGGIGFTVPLFVADLAFPAGQFDAAVKLGLLLASLPAGLGGLLLLRRASRPAGPGPMRP